VLGITQRRFNRLSLKVFFSPAVSALALIITPLFLKLGKPHLYGTGATDEFCSIKTGAVFVGKISPDFISVFGYLLFITFIISEILRLYSSSKNKLYLPHIIS
jgi:hypothetical protein